MSQLQNLAAIAMPSAIFCLSLWSIVRAGQRMGTRPAIPGSVSFGGTVWLGVCVVSNATAAMWTATVLSSLESGWVLPPPLLRASMTVGVGLFVVLGVVLTARDVWESLGRLRNRQRSRTAK